MGSKIIQAALLAKTLSLEAVGAAVLKVLDHRSYQEPHRVSKKWAQSLSTQSSSEGLLRKGTISVTVV